MNIDEKKQSRRDFIRGSLRYLTLGGLVFMGGALFVRRKKSSTKEKCNNPIICRDCPSLNNCSQVNN